MKRASFGKRLAWRLETLAYDLVSLLLRALGFARASALGGWLLRRIGPRTSKHRIVTRNLGIAFPDHPDREAIAREAWDNIGRTFFEFPLTHRLRVPGPQVRVEGREHLDAVVNSGEPCIVVTGHFANWEVMACVLARSKLDVAITYRRINNPYLDARVRAQRAAYGTKLLVPKSGAAGARHLLASLRRGESVALLNDQKFNTGESVPFFGRPAMTAPGPTRLALQVGAPVLLMSCARQGAEFVVRFEPPFHPDSVEHGLARIVAFTEATICANPAQWFWAHRRWPKGEYGKPTQSI